MHIKYRDSCKNLLRLKRLFAVVGLAGTIMTLIISECFIYLHLSKTHEIRAIISQKAVTEFPQKADLSKTHEISAIISQKAVTEFPQKAEPMVTWKPLAKHSHPRNETLPHGTPLQVADLDLYILTAAKYEHVPVNTNFNVSLLGWIRHNYTKPKFVCCLKLTEHGTKIAARAQTERITNSIVGMVNMILAEFSCSVSEEQFKSVGGAGFKFITFAEKSCLDAPDVMLEIVYPERVVDSVGVCPKVLYGNLDPIRLIEWFEYAKIMNVTRVFTYYAEIDPEPLKVFDYYRSTGFLETYELHVPGPKGVVYDTKNTGEFQKQNARAILWGKWILKFETFLQNKTNGGPLPHFRRPRHEHQAWMNEIVAINDCKLRMSGFDYLIIMDVDEIIVPSEKASVVKPGDGNYLSILKKASQTYPDAAGFMFNAYVMLLGWGKSRDSPVFFTSYVKRTLRQNLSGPKQEVRLAMIPKRTAYSRNNFIVPKGSWKNYDIPEHLYKLFHFRRCKPWLWTDCETTGFVRDLSLVFYEKQLLHQLLKLPLFALTNDISINNNLKSWLTTAD